jgi:EAL domain-containing protein (putative c-di-GMP-specific phosphodiesterase class I)
VRWQHPQRGLVPPTQFIPFAEQTGFVRTMTMWMLDRTARAWREMYGKGLTLKISVNLSTRDLVDQDLPTKIEHIVRKYKLTPGSLVLEITESATMDDPDRSLQTLERLHALGLSLSIDDFGTGYSSLAYLKRLPVDELKIDKSFVMKMESDLDDAKIVRSTIDLAHNLGLSVVAEGIENEATWKLLAGLKCDEAQGYFISRPMPAEQFVEWAQKWTKPRTDNVRLSTDFANMI